MKVNDIENFEIGNHCFGKILRINGKNYEDFSKQEIVEFILDMFENDVNADHLLMETFENALTALQFEQEENYSNNHSICDQCGNDNSLERYIKKLFIK